jgi:hypothetical protein
VIEQYIIEDSHEQLPFKLYSEILALLFAHRNKISMQFSDLKSLYHLSHIAVTIINPDDEIVIFSATPSVEYNIITENLWREDIAFNLHHFEHARLVWWDENTSPFYNQIKSLKEISHHFTVGFNLYKKVNNFKFIYSFASRNPHDNIRAYYMDLRKELFALGDYSYKLMRNLYVQYCPNHIPPTIVSVPIKPQRSSLRIIK